MLMILDRWGMGNKGKDDVIHQTSTPCMDYPSWPQQKVASETKYSLCDE